MSALDEISSRFILNGPVEVVCDRSIQGLCAKPYPGHAKGCPNFGKRPSCPPKTVYFFDAYEPNVYVAALEFDFAAYRALRKTEHPGWTERQLRNPLYWQNHVRARLCGYLGRNSGVDDVKKLWEAGYWPLWFPESKGVNVTETCRRVLIDLQWPPDDRVYVVVLFVKVRKDAVL